MIDHHFGADPDDGADPKLSAALALSKRSSSVPDATQITMALPHRLSSAGPAKRRDGPSSQGLPLFPATDEGVSVDHQTERSDRPAVAFEIAARGFLRG
jgi:hypothetical protein